MPLRPSESGRQGPSGMVDTVYGTRIGVRQRRSRAKPETPSRISRFPTLRHEAVKMQPWSN